MTTVLVDNSALRLFALRDPTARTTNRLMRILGVIPMVSTFTVEEVLHGLLNDPGLEEIISRCRFLLSLENLWWLPTREECIWYEYTRQTAMLPTSGPFESVQLTTALLHKCILDKMPTHVVDAGKDHYAGLAAEWGQAVEHLLGGSSVEDFRNVPFDEIASVPVLGDVAVKVIATEIERRGLHLDVGLMLGASMNAARNNGRAPYLAGEIRVHTWSNWWVARQGTVRRSFREDLKLLVSALCADYVLSADRDFLKYGPQIFPEVRFVSPSKFLRPARTFSEDP